MNWEKLLLAAVKEVLENKDFAIGFERAVDYKSWPNCIAKDLADEFFTKAKNKNIFQVQIEMGKTAAAIEAANLHSDFERCLAQINMAAATGIGLQLASKFESDPINYKLHYNKMQSVSGGTTSVDLRLVSETIFKEAVEGLESTKTLNKYVSGYPLLSRLIGGFNESRITMCVAGTGVGKTTFMLNLALEAIKDFPVLFINMEMSLKDILQRIAAIKGEVSQNQLDHLTQQGLEARIKANNFLINNNAFFMTDGSALSPQQIANEIFLRRKDGVKFVIIDYDQKIKADDSFDQEWKVILKTIETLEEVAKECKVHIIVLAQGDENNEPRASKRSKQPCSAVLGFFQEGSKYYIESIKNRFGPKFKLEMACDFSKYSIKEKEQVSESTVMGRLR